MARARSARASTRVETAALLVRRVPFGEADLVATFFTAALGLVGTVARGARRGTRRFSALEPVHLLHIAFDDRPDAELVGLREASIAKPRPRVAGSLERLATAGMCLRWIRRGCPPRTPEPHVFHDVEALLDALDDGDGAPRVRAAGFGLRLLVELGWGLELEGCAVCGKPCAAGVAALVDPGRGGLVCRACGGGPVVVRGELRARLRAATAGDDAALDADGAEVAIGLVEAALATQLDGGAAAPPIRTPRRGFRN